MNRRDFLASSAGAALAAEPPIPIIDTHIHLFDPARPQGVPWPNPSQTAIYKPALPARYRAIAVPLGIKGAIEVEASPWLEDNQWVLDVAAKDTIIVGTIGNLEPGKPGFGANLERFTKNPLFRGIRNGNLWNRNLAADLDRPGLLDDLKLLAQGNLTLDTANPNPELIGAIVSVTDRVPGLRVVLDHIPSLRIPEDAKAASQYRAHLAELGRRPQVFAKLSAVYRRIGGEVPRDLSVYRATLDELFGVFGEDRVVYGSDWPNSDQLRPYPDVLAIVQEYFATKPRAVREKYFWRNSAAAYRWVKRDPGQPSA